MTNDTINDLIQTQCKATKDETHDWITYYDIAEVDLPLMDNIRAKIREERANDVVNLRNFAEYCNRIQSETGDRPTKFKPNENYDLYRFEYKGTKIEFLRAKKDTKRTLFYIAGSGYCHRLTDGSMRFMQSYGDCIEDINCITCNYRCAPDDTYKETLEDVANCYEWLIQEGYSPYDTVFFGDSSGGGTALASLMYLRDSKFPMPSGLVIMSAFINFKCDTPSYITNKEKDCVVGHSGFYDYIIDVHTKGHDITDPYLSPSYGDYSDLPETLVQVSSDEIDFDDNVSIVKNCLMAGTSASLEIYNGMYHDWPTLSPELATTRFTLNQVKKFVNGLI